MLSEQHFTETCSFSKGTTDLRWCKGVMRKIVYKAKCMNHNVARKAELCVGNIFYKTSSSPAHESMHW